MRMRRRAIGWGLAGLSLAGGVALACSGDLVSSVHFNSTGADFALPPSPLVVNFWGEDLKRDTSQTPYENGYVEGESERREARRKALDEALASAQAKAVEEPTPVTLRAAGVAARAKLASLEEDARTDPALSFGPDPVGLDSVRDRAQTFEIAATRPSRLLRDLLRARALLDDGKPKEAQTILDAEKAISGDPLEAQWRYLTGIARYDEGEFGVAATSFEEAAKLKASPRRAPALIMVARSLLRAEKPLPSDVDRAIAALDSLDAEFPNGLFAWSSRGWRGRAALVTGKRGQALAAYLKQLDTARTSEERLNALASVRQTLAVLDASGAAGFRSAVKEDPTLLRPYLSYRIHHTVLTADGRRALYAFVQDFSKGTPPKLGGDLRASLAEMALAAGDRKGAMKEASAALAAGADRSDLARYVLGGVALQEERWGDAIRFYTPVTKGAGPLRSAAKEPLAIAYERTNRLGKALDLYDELGYNLDRAYLLDVRMTPEEIRAYLPTVQGEKADLVRYSLGMRLLRLDRYDEAEAIFTELGERRRTLANVGSFDYAWLRPDDAKPAAPPTTPTLPIGSALVENPAEVDALYDPLTTARDLRKLRKAFAGAAGETRAEAIYAYASYLYTRRNLLLYNAPLWQGGRQVLDFANDQNLANTAKDRRAIVDHLYEHECLWQARTACLQIVRESPNSPWAAKALYRAATSERRLADFNTQWRTLSRKRLNLWNAAAGHLEELARRFPNDPLAKNAKKYAGVFREEAGDAWKALTPDERLARLRLRAQPNESVSPLSPARAGEGNRETEAGSPRELE